MQLFIAVLKTVAAWLLFAVECWFVFRFGPILRARILGRLSRFAAERHLRGVVSLFWTQIARFMISLVRIALGLLLLVQLSFLLSYTFSLFPLTQGISTTLLDALVGAFESIWNGFVDYLPNLAMLFVIGSICYYLTKLFKIFFLGIERGDLHVSGFYPDWAQPTFDLVRFLLIAFALVVSFPYLPGSGTGALQGVSIFFGVLLTFGSSSAVSNAVAGVFITYMRPYKIGDRIRVGDTFGDVIEKNLLITRIRTIKNVEVTVPNGTVLSSQIINLSAEAKTNRLILNTSVTIGYDAPWRTVHELLIAAARATEHVLESPAPFVLQTALNDFNVSYEINAYTDQPNLSHLIYSELHANIQEKFNQGGVEIMSPNYFALRDGNTVTIPEADRPAGYDAPSFRVKKTG